MAKNHPQVFWIPFFELRQHGRKLSTIWSLEVRVHHKSNKSVLWSSAPVVTRDWMYGD